ncbi:MAG: hypothetical protein RIQ62_61, partial [Bacteroidota bacterium]
MAYCIQTNSKCGFLFRLSLL